MSTRMHNRNEILLQAIAWFIVLPHATSEQQTAFAAWIKTSPIHIECFQTVTGASHSMPEMGAEPPAPMRSWKRIAQVGTALMAACIAFVSIAIGVSQYSKAADWVEYAATAASSRAIELSDGTKVVVEAGSRVRVQTLPWALTVRVDIGDARFDVADAWSAFRVRVGDTVFEDIGTSFRVSRRADGSAFVGVLTGAVDVRTAEGRPVIARIRAGNWALVHPSRPLRMSGSADPGRGGGPPERRMKHYVREPLSKIVEEINRYSGNYWFIVEDDAARRLSISGNFNIADPKLFIWGLQQQEGLEVVVDQYLIVIRSSDQAKRSVAP